MLNSEENIAECGIMMRVNNQHCMNCEEFFINTDEEFQKPLVVIFQKAECSLRMYLSQQLQPLPESKVVNFMAQIAIGLDYLHTELNVTHRCLRPNNVLIFQGDVLKVVDFGVLKEHDLTSLSRQLANKQYAAPEVWLLEIREKLAPFIKDIYSFGLIACEMMARELP